MILKTALLRSLVNNGSQIIQTLMGFWGFSTTHGIITQLIGLISSHEIIAQQMEFEHNS